MMTFYEREFSPYYKYLANSNRTISLFVNNETCATYELDYFEDCQSQWKSIDMPRF